MSVVNFVPAALMILASACSVRNSGVVKYEDCKGPIAVAYQKVTYKEFEYSIGTIIDLDGGQEANSLRLKVAFECEDGNKTSTGARATPSVDFNGDGGVELDGQALTFTGYHFEITLSAYGLPSASRTHVLEIRYPAGPASTVSFNVPTKIVFNEGSTVTTGESTFIFPWKTGSGTVDTDSTADSYISANINPDEVFPLRKLGTPTSPGDSTVPVIYNLSNGTAKIDLNNVPEGAASLAQKTIPLYLCRERSVEGVNVTACFESKNVAFPAAP